MSFIQIYLQGFLVIMILMTSLWLISIFIKNVSIVDPFWGFGFVAAGVFYFIKSEGMGNSKIILISLLIIWGLRLSFYLAKRNLGKGEDFRYQKFRKDYGEKRYWWFSFFQTFLLQGALMWLISAAILAAMYYNPERNLNVFDYVAIMVWLVGFAFEAGGDYQMAKFKSKAENKGKVLNTGFWRYTRHPNYFGDATVWWAFGIFAVAAGSYFSLLSSLLMTFLLVKVSGVALLERSLKTTKPQYKDYIEKTNAFLPWFPKK